jgi:D-aminopeptidase
MHHSQKRTRVREFGIQIGKYSPGTFNAITDVSQVKVGHVTLLKGSARTGITAIIPNSNIFQSRLSAGGFVLNGAGELTGLHQIFEWGLLETPILLTNTLSVGTCYQTMIKYLINKNKKLGLTEDVAIPVVGECDDSWLNAIRALHVKEHHVLKALKNARGGPVQEGSVGGGTGMITCDFKAGIGTSSRKLPKKEGGFTLGVLVQSNFGDREHLKINGIPARTLLKTIAQPHQTRTLNFGSILVVLATDAPLLPQQLSRLSKRAAFGIARVGSTVSNGSGEIIISFSTTLKCSRNNSKKIVKSAHLQDRFLDPLFSAAIECTEEAILNSLFMAEDMMGRNGHFSPAISLAIPF